MDTYIERVVRVVSFFCHPVLTKEYKMDTYRVKAGHAGAGTEYECIQVSELWFETAHGNLTYPPPQDLVFNSVAESGKKKKIEW